MRFVVLSSARGTTFQAVLDALKSGQLTAQCLGLVADSEDRGCVEKAKAAGLPVKIVERTKIETIEEYDRRLHQAILELAAGKSGQGASSFELRASSEKTSSQLVIAAIGWLHILSSWFVNQWKDRVINVHPALLPRFGGQGMYGHFVHETVLALKETESGITIHLIDQGIDTGPILLQKKCPVLQDDTVESLTERVQGLEKEWYPRVLQMIERGEMKLP